MVIWLLGVSGAGKSTLGELLMEYCVKKGRKAYMIDGDFVRSFFKHDLGYSRGDRMENIKRIILAAYAVSQSGTIAIISNISPFEELRDFCRENVPDYNEIYLKRDITVCKKKDTKKMYRDNIGKTAIVGMEVAFDEPQRSDLVVDIEKQTVAQSFATICSYLKKKYPGVFK
ncbi:MAG: adenylyl-sulfate kinase [Candidatus Omnitrophica bacterium]|nr:adenylyl-sulfate kinase [Candidatus Omnitrophota bacterium]